jgi:hypothetical protein
MKLIFEIKQMFPLLAEKTKSPSDLTSINENDDSSNDFIIIEIFSMCVFEMMDIFELITKIFVPLSILS